MNDGNDVDKMVRRYYQLKQKQKETEQELSSLRGNLLQHCQEREVTELESGGYKVKLIQQERKEFDDNKLYQALPDPEIWRLMSKPDPSKIAGLLKLNVISAEKIKDAYTVKQITLLQVDRK